MGKFIAMALARGYIGGKLREPGEKFEVDEASFSSNWMERVSGAAFVPATPPGPVAGVVVTIPADWRAMHYTKRIALAKLISGMDVTADVAVGIIEAEANARDDLARLGKTPVAPTVKTDADIEAEANKLAEANDARDAAASADEAAARAADEAEDEDL